MKKFFTLLFFAGLFTSSFAQGETAKNKKQNGTYNNNEQYNNNQNNGYNNSTLVVNAYSQNGFTVTVDNGNTYQSNGNLVTVGSLLPGNHTVTVSEYRSSILGRQIPRIIYNSAINFKQNTETTLKIDNNGQVNITERQLSGNGNNGKGKKYKKHKYPHDNRNGEKQKNNGNNNDRDDD